MAWDWWECFLGSNWSVVPGIKFVYGFGVRVEQKTVTSSERTGLDALLDSALLVDLEVSPAGKILKIGAARGGSKLGCAGAAASEPGLRQLDKLAGQAACLLGHNLLGHDLPVLRGHGPGVQLLHLPVIDTLVLSPLCFPENPYHRLVKDYKLVRESINDPVADALRAATLFRDEFQSLQGLQQTSPALFQVLHYLLASRGEAQDQLSRGMALVFDALGATAPAKQRALELCRELIANWGCSSIPVDEALVRTQPDRLALAYMLTWLRVAGSNSVLPPWVRLQHPRTGELIKSFREVPCASPRCAYCQRVHNSRTQLKAFFGFDSFRAHPPSPTGRSLQQEIIEAGMRDESLLATLPTGGGKSLCFQLPALVRNYRRGVLTIVISPLQALMKDQVDGLVRRTNTPFAAALYGLLTPPERADVLRKIRLGDVALLYVSPEQLRNRSFGQAIAHREIGCWVFDEAHCLSKWGHDFRPDYLYAGRFIREFSRKQGVAIPSIACFTATAKQDVREEILAFFKTDTGRELKFFEGGVERHNLCFEVQTIPEAGKLERVHDLLSERLPQDESGSAIVFRATRNDTELTAEFLEKRGWTVAHFHAGLTPPEKKRVQDEFLAGARRVICATNAFGMGIDKEDVRLVVHADTPGSLENYLQEAGRAGRDGRKAECILLYAEDDSERQFRMEAFSELSRRDIAQILRSLRKAARGDKEEIVITSGEILRDEDLQIDIDLQDRMADTKVRTAISWLERAHLVERDENVTTVFQARPLVENLEQAERKISKLNLSLSEQSLWLAILREIFGTEPTESITVDTLALLPEFSAYAKATPSALRNPEFLSAKILKILGSMSEAGLMKRDMRLTAFVRHKVADHSRLRQDRLLKIDRKLLDVLQVEEPDPEGWMVLSLRALNQRLLDEGFESSTQLVRSLLKSLSEDGRGASASQALLELKYAFHDTYRVRIRSSGWKIIAELAEKRRRAASVILDALMAKVPAEAAPKSDYLVDFHFEELHQAIESDPLLKSEIKDMDAAIQRALLFLHEQDIIKLQHGLAVFRSAMTIRFQPEGRGQKYTKGDYEPLQHHYKERVLQVHVMAEYARRGLERVQEALELVLAYFTLKKEDFLRRYFASKPDLIQHATTAHSFQRIVTDLANPAQIKIVTAPVSRNMLILAGPGSGKTKTVVHRCAYLLRVERVRPRSILVCCFNRSAAMELRRRLTALVGDDARGVTVLTYHALATRLLGYSFAAQHGARQEINFDALIRDATKLFKGERVPAGVEADDVRDRLLSGFEHILVDEYQDIDEPQYELISAIAGRTIEDPELKLSILAVGDDDQNIYTFRGANVEFIRRFQDDYQADSYYLVENYRSTRYIIEAANQLIAANRDRMKRDEPIRIDRQRELLPPGGEFATVDTVSKGKVQIVEVADAGSHAEAVISELKRLRGLGVVDWSSMAVLSREHVDLAAVRALAEREKIPVRWVAGREMIPPLHSIREISRFLSEMERLRHGFKRAEELSNIAAGPVPAKANPWTEFLNRMLEAWRAESGNAESAVQDALEFFHEACAESRRDLSWGEGVTLSTVHAAKGTEYDHVLVSGPWRLAGGRTAQEEERRTLYVALTRARKTLSLFDRLDARPLLAEVLKGSAVVRSRFQHDESAQPVPCLQYKVFSLRDVYLGYAGRFGAGHPVHEALADLEAGDKLTMQFLPSGQIGLFSSSNVCVARLSTEAEPKWRELLATVREVRLLAMLRRTAEQDQEESRREGYRIQEWEVPWVEVVTDRQ